MAEISETNDATAVAEPASGTDASASTPTAANPETQNFDKKEFDAFKTAWVENQEAGQSAADQESQPDTRSKATPDAQAEVYTSTNKSDDGSTAEPDGLDEALRALTRDGLPDKQIQESFERDREGMIDYGQDRLNAQADQDKYGNDYRQDRGEFEAWQQGQGQQPVEQDQYADPQAQYADPPMNVAQAIDEALSPLKDHEIVDDLYEPIRDAMAAVVQQLVPQGEMPNIGEYEQRMQTMDDRSKAVQYEMVDQQLTGARSRLAEQFPELKDDGVDEQVLENYDIILPTNKYDNVYDIYEAAFKWWRSDQSQEDLKSQLLQRTSARRSGQPRAASVRTTKPSTNNDDREFADYMKIHERHYGKETVPR